MKLFPSFFIFTFLLLACMSPRTVCSEELVNEVFLLERHDKLLAFSGIHGKWFEKDLHTGETIVKSAYNGNVAVAHTTERVLAFSTITVQWSEKRLRIHESVESISAKGNVGTVITNIRALGFSAKNRGWVESLFNIGE